ncbi:MAG: cytochrome c oxidase subunit 3 [Anaerolineales bacterium]
MTHDAQVMAHTAHMDGKRLGVNVFIGLTVLTVIEFFAATELPSVFLLAVIALIKAGLVMSYYMHIGKLNANDEALDRHTYAYKTNTNRLGLWLFLLSDSFVFGGLLVVRFGLVGGEHIHLNQFLGLLVTAVLLISSFFMNRAEVSIEQGDRKGLINGTLITLILGTIFLVGVVFVEWPLASHEGITPSSGVDGATFYMMTGMHAFHVLTGLIFLGVILRNAMRGLYSPEKHFAVEAAAVYWHFVDVVWIFFYPALYLVGLGA